MEKQEKISLEEREERKEYMWDVNHDIGHALAELRVHRGLTIEQAAVLADYNPTKLELIERGNMPRNIHNLARIIEVMGGRLAIVPEDSEDAPHCMFIELVKEE